MATRAQAALTRIRDQIGTVEMDLHLEQVYADLEIVQHALATSPDTAQTPTVTEAPVAHRTFHAGGITVTSWAGHDVVHLTLPDAGTFATDRATLRGMAAEHGDDAGMWAPLEPRRTIDGTEGGIGIRPIAADPTSVLEDD